MRLIAQVVALSLGAGVGWAQTNDPVWRSWRWLEEVGAPRATGMAGAFVAVADDASAVVLNPAGLGLLPQPEIAGSIVRRGAGSFQLGDRLQGRTGVGYVGGGGRLTEKWALGGYLVEAHDERIMLASSAAGNRDTGYLETTTTDGGAAVSWHPASRLYVGLRLNITHLRLTGLAGRDALEVGMAAVGKNRVAGDVGMLVELSRQMLLGVSYRQGARWEVERTSRAAGVQLPPSPYQFSSPSVLSSGLSFRASRRLLVTGQADYVVLQRLGDTFAVRVGAVSVDDYEISNTLDARLGAEASFGLGGASLQVRGGLHSQGPSGIRFVASSPAPEAAAFSGSSRLLRVSSGASLVTRAGLRVDAAMTLGGERTVLTGGVALRF